MICWVILSVIEGEDMYNVIKINGVRLEAPPEYGFCFEMPEGCSVETVQSEGFEDRLRDRLEQKIKELNRR